MGYCIVHNPLLLQPLRHWFTFIFRKYEHLAVGSSGLVLLRSRGLPSFQGCRPSPFVPLLYHTLRDLSRGLSALPRHFFGSVTFHPVEESPPPLDIFIVPQVLRLVNTFLKLFLKILGAVVGIEPTFSKGERSRGCDPLVSQPFCGSRPFYLTAM